MVKCAFSFWYKMIQTFLDMSFYFLFDTCLPWLAHLKDDKRFEDFEDTCFGKKRKYSYFRFWTNSYIGKLVHTKSREWKQSGSFGDLNHAQEAGVSIPDRSWIFGTLTLMGYVESVWHRDEVKKKNKQFKNKTKTKEKEKQTIKKQKNSYAS